MRYTKKNDFRRNSKFHMENVIAFLFILFAAPAWCVADIQQDKDGNSVYPRKPYRFEIEVFPVGHVFRSGHKLSLSISQPPLDDPVPVANKKWGTYKYESNQPPGTVTIYRGTGYPSSVLLPVLPGLPPISENPPDVGDHMGINLLRNEPDQ